MGIASRVRSFFFIEIYFASYYSDHNTYFRFDSIEKSDSEDLKCPFQAVVVSTTLLFKILNFTK